MQEAAVSKASVSINSGEEQCPTPLCREEGGRPSLLALVPPSMKGRLAPEADRIRFRYDSATAHQFWQDFPQGTSAPHLSFSICTKNVNPVLLSWGSCEGSGMGSIWSSGWHVNRHWVQLAIITTDASVLCSGCYIAFLVC